MADLGKAKPRRHGHFANVCVRVCRVTLRQHSIIDEPVGAHFDIISWLFVWLRKSDWTGLDWLALGISRLSLSVCVCVYPHSGNKRQVSTFERLARFFILFLRVFTYLILTTDTPGGSCFMTIAKTTRHHTTRHEVRKREREREREKVGCQTRSKATWESTGHTHQRGMDREGMGIAKRGEYGGFVFFVVPFLSPFASLVP